MERMDSVALLELLKRTKPTDILQLCQTSQDFARLCRRDEVFWSLQGLTCVSRLQGEEKSTPDTAVYSLHQVLL